MSYQDPIYSKPADEFDQYGNPIAKHGCGGGDQFQPVKHGDQCLGQDHGKTTGLRRSGSSSSSSSEDDGEGGRRKKGMKEKMKEKLPGQAHKNEHAPHATATPAPACEEKKGMMDKIKEKLPGGNH